MDKSSLYRVFADLHVPRKPVVLFNVWDAGSARALADAGADAIATGSASVAGALGFPDGEGFPIGLALENAKRIVDAVDLPVTLDFEGGYAVDPEPLSANAALAQATGVVGINFEDQIVGGGGLHDIDVQAARIAAIRAGAGADFWINARTDIFLKARAEAHTSQMVEDALTRAKAYQEAGGSSLFAPGLRDLALIESLCSRSPMPVNIMMYPGMATRSELASAGVARISHGPFPWLDAMKSLKAAARDAMA